MTNRWIARLAYAVRSLAPTQPPPKQLAGTLGQRSHTVQFPSRGRHALVGCFAVIRHCQPGVQLSCIRHAFAGDLAGLVDRISSRQIHKRPRIANEVAEVRRLCSLPDKSAPEVRISWLDAETDNLAPVVVRVAAAHYRRNCAGKTAVIQHAGLSRPQERVLCSVFRRLRNAYYLASVVDAAGAVHRAAKATQVVDGAVALPQYGVCRCAVADERRRQAEGGA